MFGFFSKKRKIKELEESTKKSFENVKKDLTKFNEWVEYLDGKDQERVDEISQIKNSIEELKNEMEGLKNVFSFFGEGLSKQLSKQPQTSADKQTAVQVVQTAVQTAVQTPILSNFTVMERAIVWALMNSEIKLSYEDLSAILGKSKSTIRGQINTIKQKSENLILEARENNNKKRLYVPEKMKEIILKEVKVRVKSREKKRLRAEV